MDEQDRPPAGTPCSVCRAAGHFCAAKCFVGASDVAICEPCQKSEDCPQMKAKEVEVDEFEVAHVQIPKSWEPLKEQLQASLDEKQKKCVQTRCTEPAIFGRRFCSKHVLIHAPGRPRTISEKSKRAVELAKEGVPLSVIAVNLNISKSTASRIVNPRPEVPKASVERPVEPKHVDRPLILERPKAILPLRSAYESVVLDMQGKIDAVLADVAVMQERVAFLRGIMDSL